MMEGSSWLCHRSRHYASWANECMSSRSEGADSKLTCAKCARAYLLAGAAIELAADQTPVPGSVLRHQGHHELVL